MTTIYLYGEMAVKFGRTWKLAIDSPAEAIRAIEANKPGLISYLAGAEDRGVKFKVTVNGKRATCENDLQIQREAKTIRISPVVAGNKDGLGQLFVGLALVALSFGTSLPILGGALSASIGAMTVANYIGALGVGMAIGGVASLVAGVPKLDNYAERNDKPSYLFTGPANVVAKGDCVPLIYGKVHAPVRIISAGIYSEDEVRPDDEFLSDGPFGLYPESLPYGAVD